MGHKEYFSFNDGGLTFTIIQKPWYQKINPKNLQTLAVIKYCNVSEGDLSKILSKRLSNHKKKLFFDNVSKKYSFRIIYQTTSKKKYPTVDISIASLSSELLSGSVSFCRNEIINHSLEDNLNSLYSASRYRYIDEIGNIDFDF